MKLRNQLCLAGCIVSLLSLRNAHAATLCVNTGAGNCYTRISDAVRAASAGDVINVGPGTYTENVVVNKPLSLIADRATIDAAGLLRGIFVDGLDYPGLSGVHISGFTVENASLEGILVLNASDVSLSGNTVTNNDQALTPNGCPLIPPFEPGETMDCGEGIHLQAVDHSIVTGNTVQSNAGGGILVSDDTGPVHHNLLSFNTVLNNAGACGISLAAHFTPSATVTAGVYKNTLYGNRVIGNGHVGAGGAGIGLFVGAPGGQTYDNVIVDNLLQENGHPGVSMHAHAPGEVLNDNMIVANTVINNGADTNDAHTPGPTGINIYSKSPATGNIISGNMIQNESYDVALNTPQQVQVQFNNLFGSTAGVGNLGTGTVDAVENFWSCVSGPTLPGSCSTAVGSSVLYTPWLQLPVSVQPNY